MKIHYNEDFDSYMTTEHHITDTIELDGVKLIPITELEKIKSEIVEEDSECLYEEDYVYSSGLQKGMDILDNHISELKGEDKLTCDRNICLRNEYNNIGCEDCVVTKGENK